MQRSSKDITTVILNACQETLSDIYGKPVSVEIISDSNSERAWAFGARIEVGTPQHWEIALWVDSTAGKKLATQYSFEQDPPDELIEDVIREITNMLAGNVKTQLSEGEEDFSLALPRIDASPLVSSSQQALTWLRVNVPEGAVILAVVPTHGAIT